MSGKQVSLVVSVLVAALIALSPAKVLAQTAGTGVVAGTVTDPSGAVIVGAMVTLTDTSTNSVRSATTNEAGRYTFPNVPPGKYDLIISKTGFRQVKFSNQEVVVAESRTLARPWAREPSFTPRARKPLSIPTT